MHHPEKPHVKLTLAGVEYRLVYDFESIAEVEEVLDKPLITGIRPRDVRTPTVSLVRAMFYATAHATHPDLTFEQVKHLVTRDSLVAIWTHVLEAWALSQPEQGDDENPTQGQSGS
jgi:hypothetical protein